MLSSVPPSIDISASHAAAHASGKTESSPEAKTSSAQAANADALTLQEQRSVEQLKARDQEVRTHEQAHISAASGIAVGGASFTFATGPDGRRYAIGGEVNIDISEVPGDPEATLRKAELIKRAALAPAQPSSQDRRVASSATAMASKAQAELLQQGSDPQIGGTIDLSA
ncbi:putative metalloprotease CJM1_0395 family protein [Methylomarinum sp. Ch1-1]|uniref:Metalloprotease CJM1_0395 family protein n=1 Tax=Methylomarinum roseum TaxID=3067653 RepID=A0AAU7NS70_9GAMM|nr:putative metalloprotease CJM1_0395 family protein [Methylomarinum sp. Ch1-1]MDP4520571.1 putative metalloprotease CJM1_0395 family protein [Methylomarinum sp. Ch1-1]